MRGFFAHGGLIYFFERKRTMKASLVRGVLAVLVIVTFFGVTAVFAKAEISKYAEDVVYQNEAGQIFFMPMEPQRRVHRYENCEISNDVAKNRVISIRIFERSLQLDRRD